MTGHTFSPLTSTSLNCHHASNWLQPTLLLHSVLLSISCHRENANTSMQKQQSFSQSNYLRLSIVGHHGGRYYFRLLSFSSVRGARLHLACWLLGYFYLTFWRMTQRRPCSSWYAQQTDESINRLERKTRFLNCFWSSVYVHSSKMFKSRSSFYSSIQENNYFFRRWSKE